MSGIGTHDPSVRASEDSSCLRPREATVIGSCIIHRAIFFKRMAKLNLTVVQSVVYIEPFQAKIGNTVQPLLLTLSNILHQHPSLALWLKIYGLSDAIPPITLSFIHSVKKAVISYYFYVDLTQSVRVCKAYVLKYVANRIVAWVVAAWSQVKCLTEKNQYWSECVNSCLGRKRQQTDFLNPHVTRWLCKGTCLQSWSMDWSL
jgi:hypothetical protein